jgi:hypothetical protein
MIPARYSKDMTEAKKKNLLKTTSCVSTRLEIDREHNQSLEIVLRAFQHIDPKHSKQSIIVDNFVFLNIYFIFLKKKTGKSSTYEYKFKYIIFNLGQ